MVERVIPMNELEINSTHFPPVGSELERSLVDTKASVKIPADLLIEQGAEGMFCHGNTCTIRLLLAV